MKSLLSIGSIVKIKEIPTRLFMILGYLPRTEDKVYDYSAVVYPVGMTNLSGAFVFNQDVVEEVVFSGYMDEEGKAYIENLPAIAKEIDHSKQKEQAGE